MGQETVDGPAKEEANEYDTTLILGDLSQHGEKVATKLQQRGAKVETIPLSSPEGTPDSTVAQDVLTRLDARKYGRVLIGVDDIRTHRGLVSAIMGAQIGSDTRTLLVPVCTRGDLTGSSMPEDLPVYIAGLVPFVVDDPYRFDAGIASLARPLPPKV